MMQPEEHILQSWHANATAWTNAIRTESIASRKLVTNKAIIDVILRHQPATLLDIGCGEGWLCRAVSEHNIEATGIDAVPGLIEAAQQQSEQEFQVCSYQDIATGNFNPLIKYDAVVFNFSLFGNELVASMLQQLHACISTNGRLFIQTLHPHTASANEAYKDGWRTGTWSGFSEDFTDPAPWYFRTLESWVTLFSSTGYTLQEVIEPIHPNTNQPASIIFVCSSRK
ncbi:MAG: class I SAM-dependent methyltransferase [Chitinophagaceae bacterium]